MDVPFRHRKQEVVPDEGAWRMSPLFSPCDFGHVAIKEISVAVL